MKRRSLARCLGLTLLMCFANAPWAAGAQSQETVGNANSEQNKALVRRWIEEGFNKKNLKVVDEIVIDDFVLNGQRVGRTGLKRSMERFFTAFPDLRVTITDIFAEGDKVALWYTVRGTHKGVFEGFRPSGKPVNWSGSDLLRIAGGKIVEGRFLDDLLGLPRQVGN